MLMTLLAAPSMADKGKTSEMPDMAFLEFLAEMEELEGNLVTPVDLLPVAEANSDINSSNEAHWSKLWQLFDSEFNDTGTQTQVQNDANDDGGDKQ